MKAKIKNLLKILCIIIIFTICFVCANKIYTKAATVSLEYILSDDEEKNDLTDVDSDDTILTYDDINLSDKERDILDEATKKMGNEIEFNGTKYDHAPFYGTFGNVWTYCREHQNKMGSQTNNGTIKFKSTTGVTKLNGLTTYALRAVDSKSTQNAIDRQRMVWYLNSNRRDALLNYGKNEGFEFKKYNLIGKGSKFVSTFEGISGTVENFLKKQMKSYNKGNANGNFEDDKLTKPTIENFKIKSKSVTYNIVENQKITDKKAKFIVLTLDLDFEKDEIGGKNSGVELRFFKKKIDADDYSTKDYADNYDDDEALPVYKIEEIDGEKGLVRKTTEIKNNDGKIIDRYINIKDSGKKKKYFIKREDLSDEGNDKIDEILDNGIYVKYYAIGTKVEGYYKKYNVDTSGYEYWDGKTESKKPSNCADDHIDYKDSKGETFAKYGEGANAIYSHYHHIKGEETKNNIYTISRKNKIQETIRLYYNEISATRYSGAVTNTNDRNGKGKLRSQKIAYKIIHADNTEDLLPQPEFNSDEMQYEEQDLTGVAISNGDVIVYKIVVYNTSADSNVDFKAASDEDNSVAKSLEDDSGYVHKDGWIYDTPGEGLAAIAKSSTNLTEFWFAGDNCKNWNGYTLLNSFKYQNNRDEATVKEISGTNTYAMPLYARRDVELSTVDKVQVPVYKQKNDGKLEKNGEKVINKRKDITEYGDPLINVNFNGGGLAWTDRSENYFWVVNENGEDIGLCKTSNPYPCSETEILCNYEIIYSDDQIRGLTNSFIENLYENGINDQGCVLSQDEGSYKDELSKYDGGSIDSASWAGHVYIAFRVEDKDEITDQSYNTYTNGPISIDGPQPEVKKYVSSVKHTHGDNENKPTNTQGPTVKINTDLGIVEDGRMDTESENAPYVKTMNDDEVTYTIRIYNPSTENDVNINNYTFNDTPTIEQNDTQTYLEYIGMEGTNDISTNDVSAEETKDELTRTANVKIKVTGNIMIPKSDPNNPSYKEIKIKFKVHTPETVPEEFQYQRVITTNGLGDSLIPIMHNFGVKGKVFIDEKKYEGTKVTQKGNGLFDEGEGVDGVKVELLDADTEEIVQISDDTGIIIQNPTYTHDGGNYDFGYLDFKEIEFDTATGTAVEKEINVKKYKVRFTYNGQVYENVTFEQAGGTKEIQSHATELNTDRSYFNNKFTTINSENSTAYSLRNDNNKSVEYNKYNRAFDINAYIGNNNIDEIDVISPIANCLNLGLAKREFDLSLENKLKELQVYINGDVTTIEGNGELLENQINYEDIYFKESDYKFQDTVNSENELKAKVTYNVSLRNNSPDNFNGKVKEINLFFDSKFSSNSEEIEIKMPGELQNGVTKVPIGGIKDSTFRGIKIILPGEGVQINQYGSVTMQVSFWLKRSEIEKAIENEGIAKTIELIAEIASYSTTYGEDIYNNGHGDNSGSINAGKIDMDSDSGNFDFNYYTDNIRNCGDPDKMFDYFVAEDDFALASIVRLTIDHNLRTIEGYVFEDKTSLYEVDGQLNVKTRKGNGKKEDDDKPIQNVEVELVDYNNENNNFNNYKVYTDKQGKYSISGFIPSPKYKICFKYGNGKTEIYNAQDYKSTIDTVTSANGEVGYFDENGRYKYGERDTYVTTRDNETITNKYGWYADDCINNENAKGYSVAKDIDTKMTKDNYEIEDGESSLTNATATHLEDYKKVYENTAETERMYVGLRWKGNSGRLPEEYNIKNINLGLAERPRSELSIKKVVDSITIKDKNGNIIVDGKDRQGTNISWTDRYVQPIIDESLLYGAQVKVTYKFTVENTGEIDYIPNGARDFYDYGDEQKEDEIVKNKADKILDFVDNNLLFDKDYIRDAEDNSNKNNDFLWTVTKQEDINNYLDENTEGYAKGRDTLLMTTKNNPLVTNSLKPGELTSAYLVLTKQTTSAEDQDLLEYNNYVEIIESTNEAGRRNYSTIETYAKDQSYMDVSRNNSILSEVENRGTPVVMDSTKESPYLILSIPGDLGNPEEENTTLFLEPDCAKAEEITLQPPFGDEEEHNAVIWVTIGIISAVVLGGGIFLIKRFVVNKN